MESDRNERIAHNEAAARDVNEEIERGLLNLTHGAGPLPFTCECGDARCGDLIHVPLQAYEDVRADPRRFLVVPGHEMLDAERVVDEVDDALVVEKLEDVHHIVKGRDPRA